ncbi:MAG: YidB family protein [Alphaproteobacteria bacterium]|nr:YidB family protein [Alphaproteobacteria bacterium]
MGFLDILNGMQQGPRGQAPGADTSQTSGGMSPITMAILGLLAWKTFKHLTGGSSAAPAQPTPLPAAESGGIGGLLSGVLGQGGLGGALSGVLGGALGGLTGGGSAAGGGSGGGGLGDLLKGGLASLGGGGGLGGLLGGAASGAVLSGGLNDLVKQLQQAGHGDVVKSWLSDGANKSISPGDLADALGADQINSLAAHSGMSRDDLLAGLSQYLPQVVHELTPHGRLPTSDEMSKNL